MLHTLTKKLLQAIAALAVPLLTLACTFLVARYFVVRDEVSKAIGATIAAIAVFLFVQILDVLPAKSFWWRSRFDRRAAYEGWWLQLHLNTDRASVFSFLHDSEDDTYRVKGYAFNSKGEELADWKSTQVFFSAGFVSVSYIWEGKSKEPEISGDRKGTTTMSLDNSPRRIQAVSGNGEILHLNMNRVLQFKLRRIDSDYLWKLGLQFSVDQLHDYERQKELAQAYLRKEGSLHGAAAQ